MVKAKNGQTIELSGVIKAKDMACNLLFLRKFVDLGLKIQLDDKKIRVYDPDSGENLMMGKYVCPNWVVKFDNYTGESRYENYECAAQLVSLDEFLQQSQTDLWDIPDLEGAAEVDTERRRSEIGRESGEEFNQTKSGDLTLFDDSDVGQLNIKRIIKSPSNLADEADSESRGLELPAQNTIGLKRVSERMLWHQRLGHTSIQYLREMKKHDPILRKVKFKEEIQDCETCSLGKAEKRPFLESRETASRPLERIHTDVMGPIRPASFPSWNRYIITFTNNFSRYARLYTLRNKSEA